MPSLLSLSVGNPTRTNELELTPQFVPATEGDVTTATFHVTEVTLTNATDSEVQVTIRDKQDVPLPLFEQVPVAARAVVGAQFRGRVMVGGITWFASTANAVVASMRGY